MGDSHAFPRLPKSLMHVVSSRLQLRGLFAAVVRRNCKAPLTNGKVWGSSWLIVNRELLEILIINTLKRKGVFSVLLERVSFTPYRRINWTFVEQPTKLPVHHEIFNSRPQNLICRKTTILPVTFSNTGTGGIYRFLSFEVIVLLKTFSHFYIRRKR